MISACLSKTRSTEGNNSMTTGNYHSVLVCTSLSLDDVGAGDLGGGESDFVPSGLGRLLFLGLTKGGTSYGSVWVELVVELRCSG